jgi:hypothetical protein
MYPVAGFPLHDGFDTLGIRSEKSRYDLEPTSPVHKSQPWFSATTDCTGSLSHFRNGFGWDFLCPNSAPNCDHNTSNAGMLQSEMRYTDSPRAKLLLYVIP